MSKIIILTKLFIKSTFEDIFNFKNRDAFSIIGFLIISVLIMICASMPLNATILGSYDLLALYDKQNILLDMIMSMGCFFVLVSGMIMILNVFFFSKDIEIILPLPVKPGSIIVSKFLSCLIYCYGAMLVVLPPLLIFGINDGKGALYYFVIVLVLLLAPIFPISVAAIISLILMRISNFSKKKDLLKTLMSVAGFIIIIGFQFLSPMLHQIEKGDVSNLESNILNTINNIMITSRTSVLALSSEGIESIMYIGITLIISAIMLVVFYVFGDKIYLKSAMGSKESSSNREKLGDKDINKYITKNSPLKNFIINDIKVLIRTPAYFLNCVLIIFLVPFILGIVITQSNWIAGGEFSEALSILDTIPDTTITLVIIGFAGFMSSANPTASSSFSREGQEFYYRKYLPIGTRTQVFAKCIVAIILNLVAISISLILAVVVLKIKISVAIIGGILGVLILVFNSVCGVIIDLKSPKLIWDNEQRAVKNNINVTKAMLMGFITIAVIILVGIVTSGSMLLMVVTEGIVLIGANYIAITSIIRDANEDMMVIE